MENAASHVMEVSGLNIRKKYLLMALTEDVLDMIPKKRSAKLNLVQRTVFGGNGKKVFVVKHAVEEVELMKEQKSNLNKMEAPVQGNQRGS